MIEIELLKKNLPTIAQEILSNFMLITGETLPQGYTLPEIEFSQEDRMIKIGSKPRNSFIISRLKKLKKQYEDDFWKGHSETLNFIRKLELFVTNNKLSFDEDCFDAIDEEWLKLKQYQDNKCELKSLLDTVQKLMEILYDREYDFRLCGDYSFNEHKIYIYEANISKKLAEDRKFALIPLNQIFECILAHEIFHSLHFRSLLNNCGGNNSDLLKHFNPIQISNTLRLIIRQKRQTVIESLAKYFECYYAREKGYTTYFDYEKNSFLGKKKHFPAWPYAGAKGLLEKSDTDAFKEVLKLSCNITDGRGFTGAYVVIEKKNNF